MVEAGNGLVKQQAATTKSICICAQISFLFLQSQFVFALDFEEIEKKSERKYKFVVAVLYLYLCRDFFCISSKSIYICAQISFVFLQSLSVFTLRFLLYFFKFVFLQFEFALRFLLYFFEVKLYMGQFPLDGENCQNVAFFSFFGALL